MGAASANTDERPRPAGRGHARCHHVAAHVGERRRWGMGQAGSSVPGRRSDLFACPAAIALQAPPIALQAPPRRTGRNRRPSCSQPPQFLLSEVLNDRLDQETDAGAVTATPTDVPGFTHQTPVRASHAALADTVVFDRDPVGNILGPSVLALATALQRQPVRLAKRPPHRLLVTAGDHAAGLPLTPGRLLASVGAVAARGRTGAAGLMGEKHYVRAAATPAEARDKDPEPSRQAQ